MRRNPGTASSRQQTPFFMDPLGDLGLPSGLRQHNDGDLSAHLSYLADCSKQAVLKASNNARWKLHRNKVGL